MQLATVQRFEVVPFEKVYQYVVRSTCYVRIPLVPEFKPCVVSTSLIEISVS